jgi:hypothetical protein
VVFDNHDLHAVVQHETGHGLFRLFGDCGPSKKECGDKNCERTDHDPISFYCIASYGTKCAVQEQMAKK